MHHHPYTGAAHISPRLRPCRPRGHPRALGCCTQQRLAGTVQVVKRRPPAENWGPPFSESPPYEGQSKYRATLDRDSDGCRPEVVPIRCDLPTAGAKAVRYAEGSFRVPDGERRRAPHAVPSAFWLRHLCCLVMRQATNRSPTIQRVCYGTCAGGERGGRTANVVLGSGTVRQWIARAR